VTGNAPRPQPAEAPLSPDGLVAAALEGDRRALARLLTAVENRTATGEAALRLLYPRAGHAHLVGITGPPGSGKSTLVAALVGAFRRLGRRVAVVAVDPTSPLTGGALLGDRVRMQVHATDPGVFIRSMAARGEPGGLAPTSGAVAAILDAVGFDPIFLETVGTGQAEVEVAAMADTTVVLEAPEMGDEIQAMKAGLLEVADLVVVNKGDRPGAQRTASQLRAILAALPVVAADDGPGGGDRPRPKRPEVLVTTATTGEGVDDLVAALEARRARRDDDEAVRAARRRRARAQIRAALQERWLRALAAPASLTETERVVEEVATHRLDPYAAADRLLGRLLTDLHSREGEER
jgi:LAO/AO transport system kinase